MAFLTRTVTHPSKTQVKKTKKRRKRSYQQQTEYNRWSRIWSPRERRRRKKQELKRKRKIT